MVAQATEQQKQVVARAFLPGATVSFHEDGTATWTEAYTHECDRCGLLDDVEGEAVALDPLEAWGLLQAVGRFMDRATYRQALRAITRAIAGR